MGRVINKEQQNISVYLCISKMKVGDVIQSKTLVNQMSKSFSWIVCIKYVISALSSVLVTFLFL